MCAYYYETDEDELIMCPVCDEGVVIIAEDLSLLQCDTCDTVCNLDFVDLSLGIFEWRGIVESEGELIITGDDIEKLRRKDC